MIGRNPHEPGTEAWARHEARPHLSRHYRQPHNPAFCCASVYGDGWGGHQCSRKPTVHYGALGYCRQHDPAAQIAKREERDRKWREKSAAQDLARQRADAQRKLRDDALAAIRQIAAGHNDPRGLACELLGKYEGEAG